MNETAPERIWHSRKSVSTLAILTNARAADQRSMIGYREMLLEAARQTEHEVAEFRPASLGNSDSLLGTWKA